MAQKPQNPNGARTSGPRSGFRADIQALRAIAVASVLLYHLWPNRLTGGFVGVDVFFVISGYLITSHLLREREKTGRIALGTFWARRASRLLPASLTTLLVTAVAVIVWVPRTAWQQFLGDVTASALYVQNWNLQAQAVDYLASDQNASPVQHFWTLSAEEQFYVMLPLLLVAAFWTFRRFAWRRVAFLVIGAATLASFAFSLWLMHADPSEAYFSTFTRAWEFGLGAILAFAPPLASRARATTAAVVGVTAILVADVAYTGSTPFPGATALLPVVGAALAIWGGASSPLERFGRFSPVSFLGRVSYAVYLWHWPFVVILPYVTGRPLTTLDKLVIIAASLLLAWLSTTYLEDLVRQSPRLLKGRRPRTIAIVSAAGMACVLAASLGGAQVQRYDSDHAAQEIEQMLEDPPECLGASSVGDDGCDPATDDLLTPPDFAAQDMPDVYDTDCMSADDFAEHTVCHYGSDDPNATQVALIGNSHAAQYLPPLERIAKDENLAITTYLTYECHTVDRTIVFDEADRTAGCTAWNDWAIPAVEDGGYDLVLTSNRTQRPIAGYEGDDQVDADQQQQVDAYGRVLTRWSDAGARIVVFRDDPRRDAEQSTAPECVAANGPGEACDRPLSDAEVPDPEADAAQHLADSGRDVSIFDPTPWICPDDVCRSVVGGVIVWWDTNHMTKTFATTLEGPIRRVVAGDRQ
ncbi:acyltransferase family protein [Microbacterium indicum]|uniref:acyltransferase family protein n=1 Tax=Microbacterium indicum TaxID=358100 RepID=UPI000424FDD3|nr:acyltransferase family protein [Microbacterium indicum]